MIKKIIITTILFCSPAMAETPNDVATELSDRNARVVKLLQENKANSNLSFETAFEIIKNEISPIIDYRQISKNTTGKHWRKTTESQKDQITENFQILLETTYAKVLSKYSEQHAETIESKKLPDGKIMVVTKVYGKDVSAKINYIFITKENESFIVDLQVEGISIISTYRRQFNQMIRKNGIEGLISQLKKLSKKR